MVTLMYNYLQKIQCILRKARKSIKNNNIRPVRMQPLGPYWKSQKGTYCSLKGQERLSRTTDGQAKIRTIRKLARCKRSRLSILSGGDMCKGSEVRDHTAHSGTACNAMSWSTEFKRNRQLEVMNRSQNIRDLCATWVKILP